MPHLLGQATCQTDATVIPVTGAVNMAGSE